MSQGSRYSLHVIWVAALLNQGCATAPRVRGAAGVTLERLCEGGITTSGAVEGAIWLKAKSKEASGQFPADVRAEPSMLQLEVTNLIGETQARINVKGDAYRIEVPGREAQNQSGQSAWGGIPLRWAQRLFLGGFPCPSLPLGSGASARLEVDDQLVVEVREGGGAEEFAFVLKQWGGAPWAKELTWVRREGNAVVARVQFTFDRPDEISGAPLRWAAVSDQGSVDVRWRRRKLTGAPQE
ncbi:MAG: hypothetical protein IT285_11960 [Bdellovibrionales bacterium]|nr:hypothetical protein [Bdellovibrionales bacterium]